MSTFILRPPRLAAAYLNKSPHSVISEVQSEVSLAECQQFLVSSAAQTVESCTSDDGREENFHDALDHLECDAFSQDILSCNNLHDESLRNALCKGIREARWKCDEKSGVGHGTMDSGKDAADTTFPGIFRLRTRSMLSFKSIINPKDLKVRWHTC